MKPSEKNLNKKNLYVIATVLHQIWYSTVANSKIELAFGAELKHKFDVKMKFYSIYFILTRVGDALITCHLQD